MLDQATLEGIIQVVTAQGNDTLPHSQKAQATAYIDEIKKSDNRWTIGLQLFFAERNHITQFFGLSLLRDYLACLPTLAPGYAPTPDEINTRKSIRDAIIGWTTQNCDGAPASNIPTFMWNSVSSCAALLVKKDFPDLWPSAFDDLLRIGRGSNGFRGAEFLIHVLQELEIEVVMFQENRSREEVERNVLIKDTMRNTNIMHEIFSFLCAVGISSAGVDSGLCERSFTCMSDLIGWVDINLVVNEALPTLYKLVQEDLGGIRTMSKGVRGSILSCLFEVVKKGMDPVLKLQLIDSINLVQMLQAIGSAGPNGEPRSAQQCQYMECPQLGMLVDMLMLELSACWCKFEEDVVGFSRVLSPAAGKAPRGQVPFDGVSKKDLQARGMGNGATTMNPALIEVAPKVCELLTAVMPALLELFKSPEMKVSNSVYTAMNKLTVMLNRQFQNKELIDVYRQANPQQPYFIAYQYLDTLLSSTYTLIQYPADFDFDDEDGDDEIEIIEAKADVHKLFVNLGRIYPDRCIELVLAAFQSLSQPLSLSPFPPLLAALTFMKGVCESGVTNATLLSNPMFMSLLGALHQSDIASHAHEKVVTTYFELSLRYLKLVDLEVVKSIVAVLVSDKGLQRPSPAVRNRSAALLLKMVEAMDGKSCLLLETLGHGLANIVISSSMQGGQLSEAAEMHLFETIALMAASVNYVGPTGLDGKGQRDERFNAFQEQLLTNSLDAIIAQINGIISDPSFHSYTEQYIPLVAHKIGCISSLSKGFSFTTHAIFINIFEKVSQQMVSVFNLLPQHALIRAKIVLYFHQMITALGKRSLPYIGDCLANLIAHSELGDMEGTVHLIDQLALEYQVDVLDLINRHYLAITGKFSVLLNAFENSVRPPSGAQAAEAPHVQQERATLQNKFLQLLQHIVSQQCQSTLYSSAEHCASFQEVVLPTLFSCIQHGDMRLLNESWGSVTSTALTLPLIKPSVVILTCLVKTVVFPGTQIAAAAVLNTGSAAASTVAWNSTGSTANRNDLVPVPPQVQSMVRSLVFDQVIPKLLSLVTAGSINANKTGRRAPDNADKGIPVRDAAAQGLIVEIAMLFWTVQSFLGSANTVAYFQPLLEALGWSQGAMQTFLSQLVDPSTPVGTFKESFKQFVRNGIS